MATILHTPQLAAAIDACTEIVPGMPAARANLKILLDRLSVGIEVSVLDGGPEREWLDGGKVTFERLAYSRGKKVPPYIKVRICSTGEWFQIKGIPYPVHEPCMVDEKGFEFTEDGLVTAPAWTKERATRLKAENYCGPCRVDGARTKPTRMLPDDAEHPARPRKKLKISGGPLCVDCTFKCAVFGK